VTDLSSQNKSLSGQLKVESIEKSEVGEKLREYEERTTELTERNAALQQSMKTKETDYFVLIQEHSKIKENLTETQDLLEDEQSKVAVLTEEKNLLNENNATLKIQGDELQTRLQEIEVRLKNTTFCLTDLQNTLSQHQSSSSSSSL
jgi:chromosome segregation ATPase